MDKSSWSVDVHIQEGIILFKIDTGAEVTAITQETWHRLGEPPLIKPSKALYGPAHQSLDVLGQVTEKLTRGQQSSVESMFVVQGLATNPLGLRAITALQLIHIIQTVDSEHKMVEQFPRVFKGLGSIGKEYHAHQASGKGDSMPRNVPIPKWKRNLIAWNKWESSQRSVLQHPWW